MHWKVSSPTVNAPCFGFRSITLSHCPPFTLPALHTAHPLYCPPFTLPTLYTTRPSHCPPSTLTALHFTMFSSPNIWSRHISQVTFTSLCKQFSFHRGVDALRAMPPQHNVTQWTTGPAYWGHSPPTIWNLISSVPQQTQQQLIVQQECAEAAFA